MRFWHRLPDVVEPRIVPPVYRSRLTGEDFSRYDPVIQSNALIRKKETETIRALALRAKTGDRSTLPYERKRA